MSTAVSLHRGEATPGSKRVHHRALSCLTGTGRPDLDAATALARELGPLLPLPASGDTLALWESLASLGAVDLTVARVAEPHLDAHAILTQAHRHDLVDTATWAEHSDAWTAAPLWQVYAAEGRERLHARQTEGGWSLSGTKPWCSLADRASHALITAWVDDDRRSLFAVRVDHPGVSRAEGDPATGPAATWSARGLVDVRSTGLHLDAVPAVAIGPPQWYLARPGFAWGGAGVAAIWYGATVALARRLRDSTGQRQPDQVALVHLGAVDAALTRSRTVLIDAAQTADDPATGAQESVVVATRVRQVVADTAEEVMVRVGHALGPGPLTAEETHARRIADLTVYLRQHHGERDQAALGRQILADQSGWRWW